MKKSHVIVGIVVLLVCFVFHVSDQLSSTPMKRGDVNGDGLVNVLDALRTVNIILGIHVPAHQGEIWAADCNGDKRINVVDVLGMVNVILDIGTCISSCADLDCDDGNSCTSDFCDSVLVECINDPLPSGLQCDDGDPCTINDRCVDGECIGIPKSCDDGNPCTDDACNPVTGECEFIPKECFDGNPCTDDACNPATGECEYTYNDEFCDDGDPCTVDDRCRNGECAGTPKNCDDSDPCTDDFCVPATGGCEHIYICNTPPTASFTVTPASGTDKTVFSVNASGSTDEEDPASALEVRWDWDDNGGFDTNWTKTKTASHQYSTAGTKTIVLEVRDSGGLTDTKSRQVTVDITVTDIDGTVYRTQTIGTQVWMAENLKVTRYRNGDAIPHVSETQEWGTITTGAFCTFDNKKENVDTYGRLYNWYATIDQRNIAPEGWHVATDEDFKQMELFLGMSQKEADDYGWRGTNEGGKMKEKGTAHWISPNTGATNESGMTALSGGQRDDDGAFYNMGENSFFWTSTERSNYYAWSRTLAFDRADTRRLYYHTNSGFAVRCVKD